VTTATALRQHHHLMPFVAVAVGIASFSAMDGLMKSASLAIGAFSAMLWRSGLSAVVMAPVWKLSGGRWPNRAVMRLHVVRGLNSAGMATAFFWGLKYLPLAEGMAISFIAPLIALYLAAVLLGETIGKRSVLASILGLAGVLVIVAGKFGRSGYDPQAAWGIGAILLSAVLYAWNLILQRQQAQVANPTEIALFQAVYTALFLAVLAPWLLEVPSPRVWIELGASAALATFSLMVIAWGYAREEASVLLPLEYSAFIWAALLGWVMFGEALTVPMVVGAVLIVTGCLIATYKVHTEQTAL
jgi:S-adenosylmethionine uptake transporter